MANPALLINNTGELGVIFEYLTYNVTGSMFLSLLAFVIVLLGVALMFGIPLEWTALLVFPLLVVMVAIEGQLLPVLGVAIFYIAIIMAKNFFYR